MSLGKGVPLADDLIIAWWLNKNRPPCTRDQAWASHSRASFAVLHPETVYQGKGWKSWADWLCPAGAKKFMKFHEVMGHQGCSDAFPQAACSCRKLLMMGSH